MNPRLKSVGAVIAGVIVAYLVITVVELITSRIYPMPAGMNMADTESMRGWIAQLPSTAFAIVLVGWALGAFVGGMLAAKIAPHSGVRHALIVGVLLLIAGIVNMTSLPHPLWMWVGALLVFVPGAYAGARLMQNRLQHSSPG